MKKYLLFVGFFLPLNIAVAADEGVAITTPAATNTLQSSFLTQGIQHVVQNSTISITMQAAPAVGLPTPRLLLMHGMSIVIPVAVNWGNTVNVTVPSGKYNIRALPVTDGVRFYLGESAFVSLSPNAIVNQLISYAASH